MSSLGFKISLENWATTVVIIFLIMHVGSLELIHFGFIAASALIWTSWALILIALPILWLCTNKISQAFQTLAKDAERMQALDFSGDVPPTSVFTEIDSLSRLQREMKESLRTQTFALNEAQEKLTSLVESGLLLSSENDKTKLLTHILMEGKRICNADAATMYLKTDHNTLRFSLRSKDDALPSEEIPLTDAEGRPNEHFVSTYVAIHRKTVLIDDIYHEAHFDVSGTKQFDAVSGYHSVSMLTVPLAPRNGEVLGVLQFINAIDSATGAVIPFSPRVVSFIEALASQSAIALDNRNLIDSQEALIDSMIQIIAGAIDAKSPYTGGHCERVPELAIMLAEEACKAEVGPLAAFNFNSAEEWREFRIGAWLHDCGKVTTPEHVVDKATKLEIVNNRIHEIRTRFEVLHRDAEIARLNALLAGEDAHQAMAQFELTVLQLKNEFTFIATSNIGGEEIADEHIDKIRSIAERTWLRHFDDRLGLSHQELSRMEQFPVKGLPGVENLLMDKPHHIIPMVETAALDAKYGFKIDVPEHANNYGEIYNLCISRGTLTKEERFKVNEHIVQTIVMLENLPFPPNLRRVPEYAGTHHETLLGTGFPRRLNKSQLSVPARIMAIADIFEALTASDRPYKKAKTLSESIRIMARMKNSGQIDGDIFELFLMSGLHLRYGERYLLAEQMDDIDISLYIAHPESCVSYDDRRMA